MGLNKLKLAEKNCLTIHIGKKCGNCQEYRVHEQKHKESHMETYLGDVILEKETLNETITQRKFKCYSYISEIWHYYQICLLGIEESK